MGKRASADGPGTAKQKASRKGSSNDLDVEAQAARAAAAAKSIPWWSQALELLEKILGDTGASEYFVTKYSSVDDRREFAQSIKAAFPLPDNEPLSQGNYSPGLQTLQAWQTCFHIQAGNKGLIANEVFTTLVQLILLEGFKSDAATVPGTEYLVTQPLVPVYFETVWETPELVRGSFGAHSVGFVKGWTRCLALTTALHIILELELVDYYREHMPSQFRSFCILKAMVPANAGSEVERIAANRDMTMASVMTRAPPNAFNTYHQLLRRLKHGESVETIVKAYENPRSVKAVLGMGPSESQAVVNLVHFLPTPAREVLARAAVEYGMRKGVLTHAALGCLHMRPGHSPELPLAQWKDRMAYTQSSILLSCQRLVAEFSATIPAMRKTNGLQEVQRMSKLCRAWEIVIAEVRSKLASDQFSKAKDTLQQGFMDGCFDDYLLQIIEECPAMINLHEIPQIKALLDQHADDIEKAAIEKSRALQIQVEAATFAKMEADLAADQTRLVQWAKEEHSRNAPAAAIALNAERRRYVKGLEQVANFTDVWLRVRTCPVASWEMEIAEYRKKLGEHVTMDATKRYMLLILDMTLPPTLSEIDEMIKRAACLLHASENNVMWLIMPQLQKNQTISALLTAERRIVDRLLSAGINIENQVSVHYHVDGMHAGDKRKLSCQSYFAISGKVNGEAWLESEVTRGKIEGVPLVRVREMRRLAMPGAVMSDESSWVLSQAERMLQRGPPAAATILDRIVTNAPPKNANTLLTVVELRLSNADWIQGCWQLTQDWANKPDRPKISYLGLSREATPVPSHMTSILMEDWWPQQPGGGPIENTSVPTSQPQLALATIGSDGLPVLPPVVLEKFDQNETYSAQWAKIVSDFRATMTNEVVPKLNVRTAAVPEVASSAATAPDFSIPPFPVPPPRVIFPTTPAADFKVDEVLFIVKGTRTSPALHIDKNFDIYLSVENTLSFGPGELCGFNVGDLQKSTSEPDQATTIAWNLASDIENILIEDGEGNRKLWTVADARHHAFAVLHIPDIGLQNYEVSPLKDNDLVSAGDFISFCPTRITDDQVAEGTLKRAVAGAVYVDNMTKLQLFENAKIIWQCCYQTQAPALIKPTKPKLFMTCSTHLEPGYFYKLT